MRRILEAEVIQIVQDSISDSGANAIVDMESSSSTLLEWDSLVQLMIISELDERLGEQVSDIMALAEATSVRGILALLAENELCEAVC